MSQTFQTESGVSRKWRTWPSSNINGIVIASAFGLFVTSSSAATRAPFLIDLARDLSSSVPTIAGLAALTSLVWGVASMIAGIAANRIGRRPLMLSGLTGLAGCLIGFASSHTLFEIALWGTLGGASGGVFTGVIFAEVASNVAESERGRALGLLTGGQSLSLLLGIPLAALIGNYLGWRAVNIWICCLAIIALGFLYLTTRRQQTAQKSGRSGSAHRTQQRIQSSYTISGLLFIACTERICYGLTAIFFATFLEATFRLTLSSVAVPLAIFATGSVLGGISGGQLTDRIQKRLYVFSSSMIGAGIMSLALFDFASSLEGAVGFGFLYAFATALARPAIVAELSSVPDRLRNKVLGLNSAVASFAWVIVAATGGWMLDWYGFASFGPTVAVTSVVGAVVALGVEFVVGNRTQIAAMIPTTR